jgi:hypothetical protein
VFDWFTGAACGDQAQVACVAVDPENQGYYDLSSLASPSNYIVATEEVCFGGGNVK